MCLVGYHVHIYVKAVGARGIKARRQAGHMISEAGIVCRRTQFCGTRMFLGCIRGCVFEAQLTWPTNGSAAPYLEVTILSIYRVLLKPNISTPRNLMARKVPAKQFWQHKAMVRRCEGKMLQRQYIATHNISLIFRSYMLSISCLTKPPSISDKRVFCEFISTHNDCFHFPSKEVGNACFARS